MDTPPPGLIGWLQCLFWFAGFIAAMVGLAKMLRGPKAQPANESLGQSHDELERRVDALEEWQAELAQKMDSDKNQILLSGSQRGQRIYDEIKGVRKEVNEHVEAVRKELSEKVDALPGEIIATLKNTGAIGR